MEMSSGDRDFVQTRREVISQNADGKSVIDATKSTFERKLEPGQSWPVEGLVGQVNGRPVFANAFLEPIADRLLSAAALRDRVEGRRVFVELVRLSFKDLVDNELIVADAESKLSPEQQQGLFAWLRSFQEETIAERGGSRAAAEASLEAEESQTLEQFVQQKRDIALVRRLMNERIEPRTIVSWRDIVQEYERRRAEFNPPPVMKLGRIRLNPRTDAEAIAKVKALAAEGKSFSAIATELKVTDGGLWQTFDYPTDGIAGMPFTDAMKERLTGLGVDVISAPLEQRELVVWLGILALDRPPSRSLFDRDVQLQLRSELEGRRRAIERQRYLDSLRSRWVTDEIGEMERRLVEIALERYWR
jgi:transposase